ncbi:MAG: CehA/McbA family metallohydrolase, partial [Phenylobacterium sp.]
RLTVDFAYTGRDQKSVIDVGLRDPQRFRGWSGGAKARFTLSEAEATPSYLPGPIPAGTWKLVLGVPNLRKAAQARYTARISFDRGPTFAGFAEAPLKAGPGWWRGDLHTHTAHSDGSCPSRRGVRVPCPVFRTLEAAAARGLDFIAVSDHNATSQNQALRELALDFDDLLLIPAREITTFQGHANVYGLTGPLDFQLGGPRAPTLATLQAELEKAHGLIAINHPGLPSGELCMGCGWTAPDTNFSRIQAIEVVNGGALAQSGGVDGLFSGIAFWEARLNAGLRITAVGGSDNHDPSLDPAKPSAVGYPTTVVHASELSQSAVLSATRAGHVFVDVTGSRDRLLEVTANSGTARAEMGDSLIAPEGASVHMTIHVTNATSGNLSIVGDGPKPKLAAAALASAEETRSFDVTSDGRRHWLRVDVRGPDGRLWLLGNPIYFNTPEPSAASRVSAGHGGYP